MTTKQRVLMFVYSNRNIWGAALALVGLLLYFTGIIDRFWYLIVPGLYAIGWLIAPQSEAVDLQLRQEMSADEIRHQLDELSRVARKKLPKDLAAQVDSIKNTIIGMLPLLVNANPADKDVYTVRETALHYLPDTLQNYLNLPSAYANYHPIKDGKTAKQLLSEQLALLDEEMKEIAVDLNKADSQKLLAHGRFLRDRFQESESWLT
ncbi:MAG: hypothetical protein R3C44_14970 [Chloroflexota bacterium]